VIAIFVAIIVGGVGWLCGGTTWAIIGVCAWLSWVVFWNVALPILETWFR
jgi:hypothetical protein